MLGRRYPYVYVDSIYSASVHRNWGGEFGNVGTLCHEAAGAAKKVKESIEEALTYCDFPCERWTRSRTNNVFERLNREIRRRARCFPDGNSALMLACARLRHVADTQWGSKKYMNMIHLEATLNDVSIVGRLHLAKSL